MSGSVPRSTHLRTLMSEFCRLFNFATDVNCPGYDWIHNLIILVKFSKFVMKPFLNSVRE